AEVAAQPLTEPRRLPPPSPSPSARRRSPLLIVLAILLPVLVGAVVAGWVFWPVKKQAAQGQPRQEELAGISRPETEGIVQVIELPTPQQLKLTVADVRCRLMPGRTLDVESLMDGRITSVVCKEGQAVKKGEVLLRLDDRERQAAVEQAKAEYDKRR